MATDSFFSSFKAFATGLEADCEALRCALDRRPAADGKRWPTRPLGRRPPCWACAADTPLSAPRQKTAWPCCSGVWTTCSGRCRPCRRCVGRASGGFGAVLLITVGCGGAVWWSCSNGRLERARAGARLRTQHAPEGHQ